MAAARERGVEPVVVLPAAETGGSAGDEEGLALGGRRGSRAWLIVAVVGILAVGGLIAGIASQRGHHAEPVPSRSPTTSPPPFDQGQPVALGAGTPTALAIADGSLVMFQTDPASLTRVEQRPAGRTVSRPAEGDARTLLAGDPSSQKVWLIEPGRGSPPGPSTSILVAYDLHSLDIATRLEVPAVVSSAAVLDGRLWLGTDHGVYTFADGPTRLAGYSGPVHAIAADPTRHRLLATTETMAASMLQIRPSRLDVVRGPWLPLDTASLAIVDGTIWVAGSNAAPDEPHVLRLDPATLQPRGPALVRDRDYAFVSAGHSVVWIGGYPISNPLSCLDPATGRTLQTWTDAQPPVISSSGTAFAFAPLGAHVVPLRLGPDCPG